MSIQTFGKENLAGTDYTWPLPENIKTDSQDNEPTRRLFNRYDGKQLLHMINHFAKTHGTISQGDVHKIEDMLQNHLPLGVKSEISVYNWLSQAYNSVIQH